LKKANTQLNYDSKDINSTKGTQLEPIMAKKLSSKNKKVFQTFDFMEKRDKRNHRSLSKHEGRLNSNRHQITSLNSSMNRFTTIPKFNRSINNISTKVGILLNK